MSAPLLSIEGVSCRFGGLLAVDNLTMKIVPGEIRALIGPNGAGKSTTLNLVTGIYQPTAGNMFLDGLALVGLKSSVITRAGIARTFQTIRLWKEMSLIENVMVGHQCRGTANLFQLVLGTQRAVREEAANRAEAVKALDLVGLGGSGDKLAGSLSYGQQRRLEIARALATKPCLLLLDEPAAGMNPQEANELVRQIRVIRDSGITVVLIEHNMPLVMGLADQISVLSFGRLIAEGTPKEVRENPDVIAAYLGTPDDDHLAA